MNKFFLTEHKDLAAFIVFFLLSVFYFLKGFSGQIFWGYDTPKIIFPFIFLPLNLTVEGILVLTDTNYPGWQAYLNGKLENY